jgi:V/A-type H+/Na+-transporting ATPase subunit F
MKIFLIGDETTVLGYSLAGVRGVIVNDATEAADALKAATQDPDMGIILITQQIASEIQSLVDESKLKMATPIVLEIPDRSGSVPDRESALDIVQRLIGIKV